MICIFDDADGREARFPGRASRSERLAHHPLRAEVERLIPAQGSGELGPRTSKRMHKAKFEGAAVEMDPFGVKPHP